MAETLESQELAFGGPKRTVSPTPLRRDSKAKQPVSLKALMARKYKKKLLLIFYLTGLFFMTHTDLTSGFSHVNFIAQQFYLSDKAFHFFGYMGLMFLVLLTATEPLEKTDPNLRAKTARRVVTWSTVVILYAIADELTQPMFGRSCDMIDFIADAMGISIGQVIFAAGEAFGLRRSIKRLR